MFGGTDSCAYLWCIKIKYMQFNLTDIKTAKSRNGLSMTAKFWINDVFVADFEDKGDGGEPFLYINMNSEAMQLAAQFDSAIEGLPKIYIQYLDTEIKIDQYLFIDLLHAAIADKTEFKLLA